MRAILLYRAVLAFAVAFFPAPAVQAETGLASYYGGRGHQGEMTCAHRTRPFGSVVTVTHGGHSIQCRVNDRGPFVRGRVIDVSFERGACAWHDAIRRGARFGAVTVCKRKTPA